MNNADFSKQLLAAGPGLIAVVKKEGMEIVFVNIAFEHYLGYTNNDINLHKLCFTDILASHQRERLLFQLNSLENSFDARSHYVIYKIKNKAGKVAQYYLYASQVECSTALPCQLYYFLLHPDLSKWGMPFFSFDTKEMFLEQFESEDFGTFEWIIEPDRIYCSTGIYLIYELDENVHEINSDLARSFTHPNDSALVKSAISRSFRDGVDANIEFRIITKQGNIKIMHCITKTITGKDDKPSKFAGSIRDITRQRNIEEDLKFKVEELYHSNKELEEFAYIASHDMQEPLRKITTFSSRLMEKYGDVLTGEGAMYLSRMTISADNMRRLINDLLEFSRVAYTAETFEKVNLNVILREVKSDLELVIEETGTELVVSQLPEVVAIHSQMKQLFTNIISNAIKFHKEDVAPLITIEIAIVEKETILRFDLLKNQVYYKITISDNGIGFEEEYAMRIFKVFQRLHGKSEYPGSGIGLAICKKIIEHHNGIIYAEGKPGEGASFIFIIPQKQQK